MTSPGLATSARAAAEERLIRVVMNAFGDFVMEASMLSPNATYGDVLAAFVSTVGSALPTSPQASQAPWAVQKALSSMDPQTMEEALISAEAELRSEVRTWVTGETGRATLDAMSKSGAEEKRWVSHHDKLTRATHLEADGQTVLVSQPFMVGGYVLMYPGDPTGPAAEVRNCRCVMVTPDGSPFAIAAQGEDAYRPVFDAATERMTDMDEDLQETLSIVANEWKAGDWRSINRLLFNGQLSGALPDGLHYRDLADYLRDMDETFEYLPPTTSDIVLRRATSTGFASIDSLLKSSPGQQVRFDGYLATTSTTLRELAQTSIGGDVSMEILIPKGSRVMPIDALRGSGVDAEREVLLNRGSTLTLVEAPIKKDGRWILRLVLD